MRVVRTDQLSNLERSAIRALLADAFDGDFSEDDWQHALGGWHVLVERDGVIVAHAALVERTFWVGDARRRAGYVEAVATAPHLQRTGLGTSVMARIGEVLVQERFDIGALSSGEWGFYARLGWERWRGPTYVQRANGERVRTPDDDDGVMVLRTPRSGVFDLDDDIACDERTGDSW